MAYEHFPSLPGSYVLVLHASSRRQLIVGRLGVMDVRPGWYLYTGSALGPGGLRGRLRHHLRITEHPHWHIDWLRRVCELSAVWWVADGQRWEHRWAGQLAGVAEIALPRFGASDCACAAHLFFLHDEPSAVRLGTLGIAEASSVRSPPAASFSVQLLTHT